MRVINMAEKAPFVKLPFLPCDSLQKRRIFFAVHPPAQMGKKLTTSPLLRGVLNIFR
jgi:hypothetical protein